jgi:hypothetical protein
MKRPEPFGPHNPAWPQPRRILAREVLRIGTALALGLPDDVAIQAETDADQLVRQHRGKGRALWRTARCG